MPASQCAERRDGSDPILFEASAGLNTQPVPVSRQAPRRDGHEVDGLGDVLDSLLGRRSTPTKDARRAAHTSTVTYERAGPPSQVRPARDSRGGLGPKNIASNRSAMSAVSHFRGECTGRPTATRVIGAQLTRRYVTLRSQDRALASTQSVTFSGRDQRLTRTDPWRTPR